MFIQFCTYSLPLGCNEPFLRTILRSPNGVPRFSRKKNCSAMKVLQSQPSSQRIAPGLPRLRFHMYTVKPITHVLRPNKNIRQTQWDGNLWQVYSDSISGTLPKIETEK